VIKIIKEQIHVYLLPNMRSFRELLYLVIYASRHQDLRAVKKITNEPVHADFIMRKLFMKLPDLLYYHAVIRILAVIKSLKNRSMRILASVNPLLSSNT
jgi:hypothetical protein